MTTYNLDPISKSIGEGWNSGTTTTIFEKEEYTIVEIDDRSSRNNTLTTISFRNVGDLNKDASIQFDCTTYKRDTNRTTSTEFSIPLCMADIFLQRLSVIKISNNIKK